MVVSDRSRKVAKYGMSLSKIKSDSQGFSTES